MVELNSNDYIQIGILCATLVTIIASTVCSYFAIRSATKENRLMIKETKDIAKQQFQLQFFAEYTRRYQEIFLYMPDEIYAGNAKRPKDTCVCTLTFAARNIICGKRKTHGKKGLFPMRYGIFGLSVCG